MARGRMSNIRRNILKAITKINSDIFILEQRIGMWTRVSSIREDGVNGDFVPVDAVSNVRMRYVTQLNEMRAKKIEMQARLASLSTQKRKTV